MDYGLITKGNGNQDKQVWPRRKVNVLSVKRHGSQETYVIERKERCASSGEKWEIKNICGKRS